MVAARIHERLPFSLAVTGEAESWLPALELLISSRYLRPRRVRGDQQLLEMVELGAVDAAVLDDSAEWELDVLQLLRMIRRLDAVLPVVVVTGRRDRHWLQDALRLAAFSVVTRPLELEELLRQIERMMRRLDDMLRGGPGP
jgi:DNA-binding NtrC family response regulator